jgi:pyruvate dehydrogenase E2 component (dihydrolipoamide acetyltransferase)
MAVYYILVLKKGQAVPVDTVIAVIGKEGEDYKAALDAEGESAPAAEKKEEEACCKEEKPAADKAPAATPAPAAKVDTVKHTCYCYTYACP